jgi:HlyD family secretion protein
MKKTLLSTLILISILLTACGGTNTPVAKAEPAAEETNPNTITAEGTLLPSPSVELAFAQGGIVAQIFIQPGDKVTKGDVIARLVGIESIQAELAAAQLEQVGAQQALDDLLNSRDPDLAQVVIDLKDAQEEYNKADDYLRYLKNSKKVPQTENKVYLLQTWRGYEYRYKTRHFKGPAPQDWIIEAQNDLALKKAALEKLQRSYDRLKDGPDAEQLPLLKVRLNAADAHVTAAEAAIELYELRAPFSGTLLSLDLAVGETANPGLPIAFLADASHWIVETKDLAEIYMADIAIGDSVSVKLDAFPNVEFAGRVTEIDPVGIEYLGDMTYKVTITLDESDPRFLWNMTATVSIDEG